MMCVPLWKIVRQRPLFIGVAITLVGLAGCGSPEVTESEAVIDIPEHLRTIDKLKAYPPDQTPVHSVRMELEQGFGDTDRDWVSILGGVAVDGQGRVFMPDRRSILVFDGDGEHIKTLGREGRGPGEFQNMGGLNLKVNSEHLYAYDDVLQRINVFSLRSLEPSHTIPLVPRAWGSIDELRGSSLSNYFACENGEMLIEFREPLSTADARRMNRYYFIDQEGSIASEKVFEQLDVSFYGGSGVPGPIAPASVAPLNVASTRSSLIAVSADCGIHSAWTEDFLVKSYSPDGSYRSAVYHPVAKSVLDKNAIIDSYRYNSSLQERARRMDFPDTWPALNAMLVDDEGRLWVSVITDDEESFEWWVLDGEGRVLAKFDWPGERLNRHIHEHRIIAVKGGSLYGIEKNAETDAMGVARYRILWD